VNDRIHWHNLYVLAWCAVDDTSCGYAERVEDPTPDQQNALVRHARAHARQTDHRVSLERGQLSDVEA
jgi:hypothetical protein